MGDVVIVYKGEAFAGDVLRFEVAAGDPLRHGFRLFFRVTRPKDGSLIALAENGMVCFDYESRSIQPLPDALKNLCTITET
jgi:acyl-CoA thioesterase FadM